MCEERKAQSFRDLLVWRQAIELVKQCYSLTRHFPKDEVHGLTSQVRRAATSVPANIAEGNSAGTRKHFVSYLRTAHGSLAELETYLVIAEELGLVEPETLRPVEDQLASVSRLLRRPIASVANDRAS